MKKYFFTITSILFLVIGIASCSNEENKTQNDTASRPTVPILDRTVSDIDGNIYKIVTIGTQTWTKSNLNVSHYRNGDPIPQVQDVNQWRIITTGAWCYYNNDPQNGAKYGKLYNWYAVNDPRGLAPTGYHVPSDAEWTTLTTFLGGLDIAGGKMKSTTGWSLPNVGADNSSGFSGLPGGSRYDDGLFYWLETSGCWWSSTGLGGFSDIAYYRSLDSSLNLVYTFFYNQDNGYSVRCVKD